MEDGPDMVVWFLGWISLEQLLSEPGALDHGRTVVRSESSEVDAVDPG
jgi:hypothetical protein